MGGAELRRPQPRLLSDSRRRLREPLARAPRRLGPVGSPRELVLEMTSGETMINRVIRLFWKVLDRIDYAAGVARRWVVDLIYGPEPPTPADRRREADREQLR